MKKDIQQELTSIIKESLKEFIADKEAIKDVVLDYPSDPRFGDLSTNIALNLARHLKKNPGEIAGELLQSIKKNLSLDPLNNYLREIKVEGAGFINFYFNNQYFWDRLSEIVLKGKDVFRLDIGKDKPVLIEFVSANPTGSLSVAHARQAVVGDCLANILDFLGFKVKREYYLNDEGNQINILAESVRLRIKELEGERIEFPQECYQGNYICDIAKEAKTKKIRSEDLGDFAANYILKLIRKELDDFGVRFDYWYSQKALQKTDKIEEVFGFLKNKDFLYEKDGALWFRSTAFGDDKDRVVTKSDGSFTYLAPDIAYHQDKYKRGFEWLINLWGPDHHGYIKRLKASVQALGKSQDSLSIIIVQLATIFRDGKAVQMSTRRGEYITLREVLNEVGIDASRFFFLMRRTSSHLDFDLGVAKKETPENPVYYVQYAFARISSILRNAPIKINPKTDLSVLKEEEELTMIKKLLQFSSVLYTCYITLDPYMLTVYLQELAESFHRFYDRHRVLGDSDTLTQARLNLIDGVRIMLGAGLELLGVSSPEKM